MLENRQYGFQCSLTEEAIREEMAKNIVQAVSNRPFGRLRLVETATTVYKLITA
jgi:hypothetical protein